ncbi:helix-turn-helix domain-containing protein [Paraconexibacter antarcticus]|uniref:Helix-turn-helix domain-containing protein n=1 Tax=Paraconexibacter antarcticus TaxID=2949664 RepID=A0ABY5DNN3_9ACTN|nr:helix-turn-helix domain-containing protein [Paraconexibacter antarcticus]UTI62229.1 helix-turn-helix domain-containing protein [Paraconexibacter antarcticus]
MSAAIVDAFLSSLDDEALDRLATLLAPRLKPEGEPTSPWLTPDEAAARLRCARKRVYELVAADRLPSHRDGRRLLFHRDELDAYLTGAT